MYYVPPTDSLIHLAIEAVLQLVDEGMPLRRASVMVAGDARFESYLEEEAALSQEGLQEAARVHLLREVVA